MSSLKFEIRNYQITLGTDLVSIVSGTDVKICGIIGCYGDQFKIILNFTTQGEPIPANLVDMDKKVAALYLPFSAINTYIDLLRNEKPVYGFISPENPHWCNISTSHEAIGDGERY